MTPDAAQPLPLAKMAWDDPESGDPREFVLVEGASATIGRLEDNDICIREGHVSRHHAIINYRDGVFTLTDLGSANGTFVNDVQIHESFPLASDDVIRLFVPTLFFSAIISAENARYGLLLGSGQRNSIRFAFGLGLYMGIRHAAERFRCE